MKQLWLCFLLFSSCVTDKPAAHYGGGTVDRDQAIKIAKTEIRRRHLLLPIGVSATVEDSWVDEEFVAPRAIYLVHLSNGSRGKRVLLYKICVNKRTGAIEDFTDMKDIER